MDGTPFDIFLSYNSRDRAAVGRIAFLLRQEGFVPWFDASDLVAGGDWQDGIEQGLRHAKGCAVFLGAHGFGDWQIQEMKVAASMAAHNPELRSSPDSKPAFRYFLVLLPGAPEPLDSKMLPAFITLRNRINLREGFASPRQLKPLIDAILGLAAGWEQVDLDVAESPYRGLEAFDAEHAEFFFGRDAEIRKLLDKLRDAPFLAVIGPSGSGKSSLVLAGLIPALRGGRLEGSAEWPIVTLVPGAHPVESLAVALDALDPGPSRNRLLEELQASPRALRLEANAQLRNRPRSARLVLVVDQFEEIFTLCRDAEERDRFLDLLLEAAEPDGRCLVIITMRADFYPRITEYPSLAEQVANQQLLVGALTKDGLTAAIEQPAFRKGVQFEPGLVSTILADAGSDAGALPLLQYALDELWKRQQGHLLTLEGYRASGGVGEAIATRANTVFEGLTPDQQAVARRVLLRLTQPGESTEDTRRRAELNELVTRPAERPAIEAAVNALVAARLLTASKDDVSGAAQVDVAHEALIRAWPRLRTWLDEDRQGLLVHRRLTEASQEWQRSARDADLLFRGSRLSEALGLAALQPDALNDLEREFLAESEALRARERAAAVAEAEARERLRRRILTGLGAFSVVALLLALLAAWQWREAGQQTVAARIAEDAAQAEAVRAESEAAAARRAETASLARLLSVQSRDQGSAFDRSMLLAAEAYDLDPGDLEVRRALLAATQAHPFLERILSGHERPINAVAFSPDDQLLASGSDDGVVRLWDPITGQPIGAPIVTGQAEVQALAFRPEGDPGQSGREGMQFASSSFNGAIQIWDIDAGIPELAFQITSLPNVRALAFSSDGTRLAAADVTGTIGIWDAETGAVVIPAWQAHQGQILTLAFSPDGTLLVSGGADDRKVLLWNPGSGELLDELDADAGRVGAVMFNPAGDILVTSMSDQILRWDIVNRLPLGPALTGVGLTGMGVIALAMSGDGTVLAAGGLNGTVWQWNMASGEPIGEPQQTGQTLLYSVALNDDGSQLATAGGSNDVRLWSSKSPKQGNFASLRGHLSLPQSIAVSPDNAMIATGDTGGEVRLWNAQDGAPIGQPLRGQSDIIWALEFNRDGSLLAAASEDGTVQIWNTHTGAPFAGPLAVSSDRTGILTLAFSPTGDWLATAGWEGLVRLWSLTDDGVEAGPLLSPADIEGVAGLAFSPEGSILAAVAGGGQILLWDMGESPPRETRFDAGDTKLSLCFVDERTIAAAGGDGTIRFWNVVDGQEVGDAINAHEGPIFKLSCDPERAMLVSSSMDGRIRLWEMGTSEPVADVSAGPADATPARMAVLSPDGSLIAAFRSDLETFALVVVGRSDGEALTFPVYERIQDVTLSAGANRVAAAGDAGQLAVWDATTDQQFAMGHTGDDSDIRSVAFNADGSRIATSSSDGAVRLWNSTSLEPIDPVMQGPSTGATILAFSDAGDRLAVGLEDGSFQLWDVATHQPIGDALENGNTPWGLNTIGAMAFNDDGNELAIGAGSDIALWNVAEGDMIGERWLGGQASVTAIAYSPTESLLASADASGQIRLWDVASRRLSGQPLIGTLRSATTLAFSKDGALLAAGDDYGAIDIWDVASRTEFGVFDPQTSQILFDATTTFIEPSPIVSLVFSDDGSILTALDEFGVITRWELSPAAWLARACTAANRNLTREEWQRFIGDPDSTLRPYHKTCADLPGPSDASVGTPVPSGASATPVASGAAA